jgi:hypothetical protein
LASAWLGSLLHLQGDVQRAVALYEEALEALREVDNQESLGIWLAAIGIVAASQRRHQRAARLLGAADRQYRAGNLLSFIRIRIDRAIAATRDELEPPTFAASWAEGEAMTLEQAVAYALEEPNPE